MPNQSGSLIRGDDWAFARVTATTGAATLARNCTTSRSGTGVFTLTVQRDIEAAECEVEATVEGAAGGYATYEHTSNSTKTIRVFSTAGAAADLNFNATIRRRAP